MEKNNIIQQNEIARYADCSEAYVNKVIKNLKNNRFVDNIFKNGIKVIDLSGLILYWAYHKNMNEMKTIKTNYDISQLEEYVQGKLQKFNNVDWCKSLFWEAKERGVSYTTYNIVSVYCTENITKEIKTITKGNKSELGYITVKNAKNILDYKQPIQVFVDLINFNTWESKSVAIKLLEKYPEFPAFTDPRTVNEILNTQIGVKDV